MGRKVRRHKAAVEISIMSASVRFIKLQWDDSGVAGKVMIGGEYLPVATKGGGADQEVGWRPGDASGSALIMSVGSVLVVGHFKNRFVEGT